jgi:hypothetical protein
MCVNSTGSSIGGGYQNKLGAAYAVIGGGFNNKVSGKRNVVAGGHENFITGISICYSSIAGGKCNKNNHSHSHIIGSCITSVATGTLHANCLFLSNIPASNAGLVAGQVYRDSNILKIKT